jgi:AraC family transcriptional regulator of adaptative response/methylated-DNA-[protein]-cysteine methyltransferase
MNALPPPRVLHAALRARDPSYDGLFFVGVKTTSIFCRPTCPARRPRPENVEWFQTGAQALRAGYRPCRRCRPLDRGERPRWAADLLALVDERPLQRLRDADLRALGVEPERARRFWKRRYGMTFLGFARARRLGLAHSLVQEGEPVTRAAGSAGFASASGFRAAHQRLFGAPPTRLPAGRVLRARWLDTPLGAMLAVARDDGVALLEFTDRRALRAQVAALRRRFDEPVVPGRNRPLMLLEDQLGRYFAGDLVRFTVPLLLRGSDFELAVWRRLLAIPAGATASYAEVARAVGRPQAVRAVGRANGNNPLAILVPCHRVVRQDGTLCGYGGGLWRKRWLLAHERGDALVRARGAAQDPVASDP